MAEDASPADSGDFLTNIVLEIVQSPVNLVLVAAIAILAYKILKRSNNVPTYLPPEPQLPKLRKDFTVEELKKYDGNQEDGRVLVAVNGQVYDVTKGKRFYGPGGPYSAFAGRDASRGLATFSVECKTDGYDDLSDLNSMEMESVREWEAQFKGNKYGRTLENRILDNKPARIKNTSYRNLKPEIMFAQTNRSANPAIVYFDLETTGLGDRAEICQIAAVYEEKQFNLYILPTVKIQAQASAVNKLTVVDKQMFYDNVPIKSTTPKVGLETFIRFLSHLGHANVILVAHNANFDSRMILNQMCKFDLLDQFRKIVFGFADTLSLFRLHLPERVKEKRTFKLAVLAQEFLDPSEIMVAHNAINDVRNLKALANVFGIADEKIQAHTKPLHQMIEKMKLRKNLPNVSLPMVDKLVMASVTLELLLKVFEKNKKEGVKGLLGGNMAPYPLVTKHEKVLQGIVDDLEVLSISNICIGNLR